MLLACITNPDDIGEEKPDLVVLPEYIDRAVVRRVARDNPDTVIATAVEIGNRSIGRLIYRGRNWINYRKIDTDWRTIGTGETPRCAVRHFPHMSVGLVICMDIQNPTFVHEVVRQLRLGRTPYKILCIPADMSSEWFSGSDTLLDDFEGVHVAMSDWPDDGGPMKRPQSPSFITDTHGRKVVKRAGSEAIKLRLD